MGFFTKIFGDENTKAVKRLAPLVAQINSFEDKLKGLSSEELAQKTAQFKERILGGASLDDLLPEAFATVREAARRTLGERHFDAQIIGGIVLHQKNIAEMKTGEGKTLVATLPAYLNALAGEGVHVVTVNDYLSRRDAVWMGQIYQALGISVGCINHESSFIYDPSHKELDKERDEKGSFKVMHEFLRPVSRREAYAADITYGTNNEFGFDYLRDNISYRKEEVRQRGHYYAIVDEVDSILIDEARTPLIISAPAQESDAFYTVFAKIAVPLKKDIDFKVDEKFKSATLTDEGITKAEKALGVENIYTEKGIKYVHHLETAVRAKALFQRDKDYVIRDGEVVIVDEFTGRLQPGRRWSEGLHQAIEAKEGVEIQRESRTFASITFQNYFRMYKKLSGMTGTALTSAEEFRKVYGLDVIAVPTNKPILRIDRDDLIYQNEQGKLKAIAKKIKALNEKGQPVLVGTVSIEKNEILSEYLSREGVRHEILNAKNHEREGEIIAQAGRKGAVTIATNMAGRGVDIKLGGNPATKELSEEVRALGGLFVLGTERHEARRIDNQLRGRAGRQGDTGETQFFVSLDDSLMRVFAADTIKNMMGRFGIPEEQAIENKLISKSLEAAQEKIEGFNFDARHHVLEYDDVMNHQRQILYGRRRGILFGGSEAIEIYLDEITDASVAGETKETIDKKRAAMGDEKFAETMRGLILQTIDMLWMEHLETMDYLRSSVRLRAYGQRDPLVEYKKEGLTLFKEMEGAIAGQILSLLPNIGEGAFAREETKLQEVHKSAQLIGGSTAGDAEPKQAISHKPKDNEGHEIGRNDVCFCGSGKKYKKCHGIS
ncbi:MAG: preprotein translocase subunit SecA [Candidatus Lloydbacteria bacterium]|nr:preprotein translocase subunit SecA [Candidatus Lloydbacteria bacterium]